MNSIKSYWVPRLKQRQMLFENITDILLKIPNEEVRFLPLDNKKKLSFFFMIDKAKKETEMLYPSNRMHSGEVKHVGNNAGFLVLPG